MKVAASHPSDSCLALLFEKNVSRVSHASSDSLTHCSITVRMLNRGKRDQRPRHIVQTL